MNKQNNEVIYIQADSLVEVFEGQDNLVYSAMLKKGGCFEIQDDILKKECHVLVWAQQFSIPYYFSNVSWVRYSKERKLAKFEEVIRWMWPDFLEKNEVIEISRFDNKQAATRVQNCEGGATLVTDGYRSEIDNNVQWDGISHYMPNASEPIKRSVLREDGLCQHQNFVFYSKMAGAANAALRKAESTGLDIYYRYLYGCEKIIDVVNRQVWKRSHFKFLRDMVFSEMPDFDFYYESDQWFGLEKCHTTTARFMVRSGAVICTYYDVDAW